jgi:hypothetical protein
MRLTSFKVQGFKNLLAPVVLDELGPINVIHGQNNVGKSNLLQAVEVFFRVLTAAQDGLRQPNGRPRAVAESWLVQKGVSLADIFNYAVRHPIEMTASLSLDEAELAVAGIQPLLDCRQVSIGVSLHARDDSMGMDVRSLVFADGTDVIATNPGAEKEHFAERLLHFLTTRFLGPRGTPHVGVDRRVDAVVDALYDASASQDRRQAMQWDRFVEVMGTLRDILGEGRFVTVLPRNAPRARLLYETSTMRIPLHALGTGVQQLVALFGHILTSGAPIVAVEEPELNLRWALQERVRDALRDLVGKEGAPSQLFLTSHSGAFESRDTFYLMRPAPGGPVVELRPVTEVPLVLGGAAPEAPATASRAPAYVSGEGTLRLPPRICAAIGVEHGGGVSFVDKGDGVVEMMSDDTLLRLAGIHDDA